MNNQTTQNPEVNIEEIKEKIQEQSYHWQKLREEVSKVIVGQSGVVDRILMCLACNGHVLLEGVPGLAKTTLIKSIAQAIGLEYKRIQFTPDLLPADLIGTLIYNPKTHDFETRKGPLFANFILADEINRAPAKVQSALLEAMEERQVTIGGQTFPLPNPFLVLATQNPIDQEGTYHLPEAQIDRFMFKLLVDYPTKKEEKQIIHTKFFNPQSISQVIQVKDILATQELVQKIYLDEKVIDYIVSLVFATRNPEDYNLSSIKDYIEYGASPRATLNLYSAAKAHAFLKRRHFVIPEDVKTSFPDVFRHRMLLTYEAEAENIQQDEIIKKILATVPSP